MGSTAARPTTVGDDVYGHLEPLLRRFACRPPDDPRKAVERDQLAREFLPVARNIARRYAGRGESREDLEQVAAVGLLAALDRFDPERGPHFLGFAVPTITGEIQRHFRDRTWPLRVSRRLKDVQPALRRAVEVLSGRLHRAPRPSEIAAHLGMPLEEVLEALAAHDVYSTEALDAPVGEGMSRLEVLGGPDPELDAIEHRDALRAALDELPSRERAIIVQRFFGHRTQSQIGADLGISQMHVSRLLSATLARLRERLAETPDALMVPLPRQTA
jgi:RNA polymerase sigma-B factor